MTRGFSARSSELAIAPTLDTAQPRACTTAGYLPQDLHHLTDGLLP